MTTTSSSPQPSAPRLAIRIDVTSARAARHTGHWIDLLRRNRASASIVCPPQLLKHTEDASSAGFELGLMVPCQRYWWLPGNESADEYEIRLRKTLSDFVANTSPPRLFAGNSPAMSHSQLRLTQRLGFQYASNTYGKHPFIPVWNGEIIGCAQIPITLPALDEVVEHKKPTPDEVCNRMLALTVRPTFWGHVFCLTAPSRPEKLDGVLEQLFAGWREQGYELTSIHQLADAFDLNKLPRHEITVTDKQRSTRLTQGSEFLSEWRPSTL